MGTVTQTIGSASRNFLSPASWEAALPASLVTDGNSYVGQCFADSEFDLGTTQFVIGGNTTDATHTITLTTAAGQGFKDNASAGSNALRYNAANGVAIKGAPSYLQLIKITDAWVTLQNLQIKQDQTNNSTAVDFDFTTGTNWTLDSCIVQSKRCDTNGGPLNGNGPNGLAKNSLIVLDGNGLSGGSAAFISQGSNIINCTLVRPSNYSGTANGIRSQYGTTNIQNCAIVGFTTPVNGNSTFTGSAGNATDAASYATGVTGQVSLTIATEFVQPSNASSVMDWRLNSTSVACKDNGTNSGAPTTDIIGQAISNTTRDVGAWELQQGGGPPATIYHRLLLMGVG